MRLISWNVNGRYGPALNRQIAALLGRNPDVVALQEVRLESVRAWREGCERAELVHVLDSSDLLAQGSLSGREYRRIYFNLIASRWPLHRMSDLQLEFPERYLAATVARDGAEFEVHVAGVPPGSRRGIVKVEMFEALYARLATTSERPRILCGDLNTPRAEHADGTVEFWGARHPPHTQRWDAAERSVVIGLADHDLPDVFRDLNGYSATDVSWIHRRREKQWARRYDHIFASRRLAATSCHYEHTWREPQRLSDHSAIEADFGQ
jgi:exonuclease III